MASSRAEPAPTGWCAILWERVSAREEAGTVTPILAPTLAYWLSRSSGAQRDEEVR